MGKQMNKSNKKNNKNHSSTKPKVTVVQSRKNKRKQDRKLKKQTKLDFYKKKYHAPNSEEQNDSDSENNSTDGNITKTKAFEDAQALLEEKKRKKDAEDKMKAKRRNRELKRANEEEVKNIKRLEKQLKLNKRKGKDKEIRLPSSFAADGLDYLLDVCDSSKVDQLVLSDDEKSEEDDQEEFIDEDAEIQVNENEIHHDESEDESGNDHMSELGESEGHSTESENENTEMTESGETNVSEASSAKNCEKDEYWEDIYGRTRDSQGNVVKLEENSSSTNAMSSSENITENKYVPPAMRAKMQTYSEKVLKLQKQIKGLLNRMAESNMHLVCRQLEELYSSNSRNDMNDCLCKLITSSIITNSGSATTPERLVMEHAVLVGILHANVGNEVGAAILQFMASQFDKNMQSDQHHSSQDKHSENYLMFICQLYAFRVTTDLLVFDILTNLAEIFDIKSVELIILILRTVGFLLRKDEPNKLKSLILKIQGSSVNKQTPEQDSRIKFMLEILLAIKNNNVKKIPNYDGSHQVHWQKIIKGFLRPGITQITPLKIGFEEILHAESRGRWWIVGSAWSGSGSNESDRKLETAVNPRMPSYSNELLSLARKMRMNTDTRKNIFCALMSAEDFMEATERLVKLTVSTQQKEREVIFVILTCCLKEKAKFNPYYSQLAVKLSNIDRKYRMASQFAIWDRIKEADSLEKSEVNNLALFTSKLIMDKALSLACLKVIEFSEINKARVKFLRTCLLEIITSKDTVRKEVFLAVAGYPKLSQLREGLRLFMRHFILKENSKSNKNNNSVITEELKEKVMQAEKNLLAGDKKMML